MELGEMPPLARKPVPGEAGHIDVGAKLRNRGVQTEVVAVDVVVDSEAGADRSLAAVAR